MHRARNKLETEKNNAVNIINIDVQVYKTLKKLCEKRLLCPILM